jgi:hypothetical protein
VDHDDPDHVEMLFRKSWRSTQAATTPATTTAAATTAIGADELLAAMKDSGANVTRLVKN